MVGAPTLVGEPIRTSLGGGRKENREETWFSLYTPGGADGGSTDISGGTNQNIFGGGEEGEPGGNMVQSLYTWWC